jgi:tetratricopeptide (TPR) repeat protein
MKIPFQSPARKRLVAAVALALATLYLGLVSLEFIASFAGNRTGLTWLKSAAWLDPLNADYHDHLGRYYDLVARDPVSAIGQYEKAVHLNQHSASYWFDLASAYQVLGDTANQTTALERAILADSKTPDVAWEAANLYLVQGDSEKALREFRVVMANDTSLAAPAIQASWRMNPDVDILLRDVVPPTADAYIAFLTLLEGNVGLQLRKAASAPDDTDVGALALQIRNETESTFKIWDALMRSHQPFDKRFAYEYVRFLIQQKEVDQAVAVWQQMTSRFELSGYLPTLENQVVNSTFTLDVLNNPFDWQYERQPGVGLTLEPLETPHQDEPAQIGFFAKLFNFVTRTFRSAPAPSPHVRGPRSLMITFDGPRISDAGFYQLVPVLPNTKYQFSARYQNKGEQEGAGGPHFTITDMYSQATYYESDELRDADSWKKVDGEFTTSPDCKLVVLHVRRLPANSPIRGKLWIDDFRIIRKPS